MSEDKLLSALNASESVKESKKNSDDTESTRNEDYDADEILKTTWPDPTKINKTIREIRKENCDKDKIFRDLRFLFDPEKDHHKPVKTVSAFNNNYIQYKALEIKTKIYQSKNILILSGHI